MLCPRIASTPRSKQGSFQVIASYERGMTAAPPTDRDSPPWRAIAAGPAVAVVTLVTALIVTDQAGVPLRDPNGVSVARFTSAGGARRGAGRAGHRVPQRPQALDAGAGAGGGQRAGELLRHLPGVSQPQERRPAAAARRAVRRPAGATSTAACSRGSDPAEVLHNVLGNGISAHALSGVYEAFFVFIPLALAFALVVLPDLRAGLFLTTALAINWMLAAGSYFLLPSLGPIYAEAADFSQLPSTGVSGLQQAAARAAGGVPARPVRGGHRAEHRRLRVAARLDLLHRGAGDAPARARRDA